MKEPLLSVIVSLQEKEEKQIEKVIDSIINSTYKNIELIVVASTESEVLDTYVDLYDNVSVTISDKSDSILELARIALKQANGHYISFLTSNEYVSCDFYRTMVQRGISTKSNLVMGEHLFINDENIQYPLYAHNRLLDLNLEGDACKEFLLKQSGSDFSLFYTFNKLLSKSLLSIVVGKLENISITTNFALWYIFNVLAFYHTNKIVNIKNNFVYHEIGSYSKSLKEYKKNIDSIESIITVINKIFSQSHLDVSYDLKQWILHTIQSVLKGYESKLSKIETVFLYKHIKTKFGISEKELNKIDFFTIHTPNTKLIGEKLKLAIINDNIRVVSFDIFDTLVFRPFCEPTDLFSLLSERIAFKLQSKDHLELKQLRIDAEQRARELQHIKNPSLEDITIDDIYDAFKEISNYDDETIDIIKNEEINLELKYCYQRKFTKELFDLALYMGKKIIITSDMYLYQDTLELLLEKQNFNGYSNIYVSSELNLTKASGNLYSYIQKELGYKSEEFIHIGDTMHSDVNRARERGWNSFFLPKAIDLLKGRIPENFTGNAFNIIFEQSYMQRNAYYFERFLGMKAVLGLVANTLFDNPYTEFMEGSDFNADPKIIGYYALGPYIFSLMHWLIKDVQTLKYDTLNFLARDGYLPLKAFNILKQIYPIDTEVNYVRFSRDAVLPLQLSNRSDLDKIYNSNINIRNLTPNKVLVIFKDFLKVSMEQAKAILLNANILLDRPFGTYESWYKFITIFGNDIWSEEATKTYQHKMFNSFRKIFGGKSATFDVGYSCRVESALNRCYGFDITPYYIHINNDIALSRGKLNQMDVKTFFAHTPGVTGLLRELLVSGMEPSLKHLSVDENDEFIYEYKEYSIDYDEYYIVDLIQKNALEFVNDFVTIFNTDIEFLHYQREDLALVHEYFNHSPKELDKSLFSSISFEDNLGIGEDVNFNHFWTGQIAAVNSFSVGGGQGYAYWINPLWKRAICLYFLDREFLKDRVRYRLKHKKLLLESIESIYRSIRRVYRLICK